MQYSNFNLFPSLPHISTKKAITKPNIENTTVAEKMAVKKSVMVTTNVSRTKLLRTGLYDARAIRHPKARPNE